MSQTPQDLKLRRLDNYNDFPGPVVFLILDGVGIGKRDESDGVFRAYTPVLDELLKESLYTQLRAHGRAVGLPTDEDMGNSEVGHNALGAGRVFSQGAMLVNAAIDTGALWKGCAWQSAVERGKQGHTLHFIGLLSDGNVHSNIDHLFAMLREAAREGIQRVRLHPLIDGRDVGERSALQYLQPTEALLAELSTDGRDYRIASGGGRMITTMDRYGADWTVVERGWKAHVLGIGDCEFASASEAIATFYEDPALVDQYLPSFVIVEDGKPVGTIEDDDAVIFFNFRGDRAIEISQAFEASVFDKFDRQRVPNVFYAGLMQYDGDAHIPSNFLVEPPAIDRTIGQYICASGVTSYAISETQKFGHVTYFWNGNNSGYISENLEQYDEIRSDVLPFDQRPWMKAAEITDAMMAAVESGQYKFLRLNYPNGDMVGHTGNVAAILIAVEAVDLCLARLLPVIEKQKGIVVITADHGNADQMFTEKKGKREPMVAHTLNPVPFVIKDYSGANTISMRGIEAPGLSNIAATLLNLLGYQKPDDYDESLIQIG
ncbi:MAG: 2,3-bisphosphoglycerate-independent phosphoglycerate mutase [FCB group bacterium]|jgi:2,3-bisphosphoglycerate-independent phosphoglycerate mutase|nr:2,3-bisphosphoglycerate-independent phosphoglycerate mutase [FCB group bacterium]